MVVVRYGLSERIQMDRDGARRRCFLVLSKKVGDT